MTRYRVRAAADADLVDIARYTRERWDDEQAEEYVRSIVAKFATFHDKPVVSQRCPGIAPGLWRRRHREHVIYYRVGRDELIIVRVLHKRMLPNLHL